MFIFVFRHQLGRTNVSHLHFIANLTANSNTKKGISSNSSSNTCSLTSSISQDTWITKKIIEIIIIIQYKNLRMFNRRIWTTIIWKTQCPLGWLIWIQWGLLDNQRNNRSHRWCLRRYHMLRLRRLILTSRMSYKRGQRMNRRRW